MNRFSGNENAKKKRNEVQEEYKRALEEQIAEREKKIPKREKRDHTETKALDSESKPVSSEFPWGTDVDIPNQSPKKKLSRSQPRQLKN